MSRLLPIFILLFPLACKSIDLQKYIPTKVRVSDGAKASKRINNAEYAGKLRGTYYGLRFENSELAPGAVNLADSGSWKIYFKGNLIGYEDIVDSEDGSTLRIYSDAKENMLTVVFAGGELGFYKCPLDKITTAPAGLAKETPEPASETKKTDKPAKAPAKKETPVTAAEDMDAIVAAFNAYSAAGAYEQMVTAWQCGEGVPEKEHGRLIASVFLENLDQALGIHPVVKRKLR